MAEEVHISIKMEPALREQFTAVAASQHRSVDQIIRKLMRLYIANSEKPNALTTATIRKGLQGEDIFLTACASDLFKQLEI